jgi:hypothetical protein
MCNLLGWLQSLGRTFKNARIFGDLFERSAGTPLFDSGHNSVLQLFNVLLFNEVHIAFNADFGNFACMILKNMNGLCYSYLVLTTSVLNACCNLSSSFGILSVFSSKTKHERRAAASAEVMSPKTPVKSISVRRISSAALISQAIRPKQ